MGNPHPYMEVLPYDAAFWTEIFHIISTQVNVTITLDPAFALLNHCSLGLTRAQLKLSLQVLTASKQTIAKAWKTLTLCTVETKKSNHTVYDS